MSQPTLKHRGVTLRSRLGVGKNRGHRPAWLLVIPALLVYLAIHVYPAILDVGYAFTDWNGIDPTKNYVGSDNFRRLLDDDALRSAFLHTVIIALVVTIVQNGLGLLVALLLHGNVRSKAILRCILFLPVVINPLVIAYAWQFMYVTGGPVQKVLDGLHLGGLNQNWLGDPNVALWAVLVPMIWQYVGWSMVIFLAGLEGIPDGIFEASELDGAGTWRTFRFITWPLLAPALTVNAVLTVIGGLNAFTTVFALTGGGPGGATDTAATVIYREAFTFSHFGYATSMALVLSIAVTLVAFLQVRVLRRRELIT